MSLQSHIETLVERHRKLEAEIQEEMLHPGFDQTRITELKRQKLKLKEEISKSKH